MRNLLNFVFLFLIVYSCQKSSKNQISIDSINNDTVKTFFNNGKLKEEIYKNGDTSKFKEYYDNGNIKIVGNFIFEKPIGIWKEYYQDKKSLKSIIEFTNMMKKNEINQKVIFNEKLKIDYKKSFFYTIAGDTLKYFSPLDTLNEKLQQNREIKLIVYDESMNEKKIKFNKNNEIFIRDYNFPMLILENASINSDSIINDEKAVRLIMQKLIVTESNSLINVE